MGLLAVIPVSSRVFSLPPFPGDYHDQRISDD
jgi:hypothetical protein